ncbi:protein DOG1-like 4 [Hevea brasiliensis]|uniref:protein DOG1-like 4 n=1 Tax=Hevea brasiliensis TaxID=3981 RepID=UPI0025EB0CB7|nr:protein DOG1-like 4 [Hevea brasiliensis]
MESKVEERASEDHRAKTGCEREQELQASVSIVTQHYKDYYTIKWALAHEYVLAFFCPIWIFPLENAYSWVTRWKPSAVLKLVNSIKTNGVLSFSLVELTQEYMRKIKALRVKIGLEEEKVGREMERQQVAVADRKMAELVRLVVRVKNGEEVRQVEGLVQVALKGVMAGLEKVMKAADCVGLRTLKRVLDVLSPL